jgi:hypothetical protein
VQVGHYVFAMREDVAAYLERGEPALPVILGRVERFCEVQKLLELVRLPNGSIEWSTWSDPIFRPHVYAEPGAPALRELAGRFGRKWHLRAALPHGYVALQRVGGWLAVPAAAAYVRGGGDGFAEHAGGKLLHDGGDARALAAAVRAVRALLAGGGDDEHYQF